LSVADSIKLFDLLWSHHNCALRIRHWARNGLHLRLLIVHGVLLLLLHRALTLHLGLVVLSHRLLGVRLHGVRVGTIGQHHSLRADLGISAVLHEHRLAGGTGLDHEVLVDFLFLRQVLLNSLLRDLFLGISNFAKVGAPSGEAEADDEVEEDDVRDEPPVEKGGLLAALVVDSAPELHLDEEHAPTDEEVEAEE